MENTFVPDIGIWTKIKNFVDGLYHTIFNDSNELSVAAFAPPGVNAAIPIFVLVNALFFILGQGYYKAWGVTYELLGGDNPALDKIGEVVNIDKRWEYNIQETVEELWDLGLYFFAVIFFIFSVIVPHSKLLLSVALWFSPGISDKRREHSLMLLDSLGRWNHYDVIIVNFLVCLLQLSLSQTSGGGEELVLYELWAYTLLGCYFYCTGVVMSQLLGHFLVYEVRAIRSARDRNGGLKLLSVLEVHQAILESKEEQSMRKAYQLSEEVCALNGEFWQWLMPLLMLVNIALYLTAILSNSYNSTWKLPAGLTQADTHYSILDTTFEMMSATPDSQADRVGMIFTGGMVLCFVLIFPVIRITFQALLWQWPFSGPARATCERLLELGTSWSALDVTLLAGLLAIVEAKSLTENIYPCTDAEGDACFYLDVQPMAGYYISIVACLFSYMVNWFVLHFIEETKVHVLTSGQWRPIVPIKSHDDVSF